MTKQQLLDDLASKTFCKKVLGATEALLDANDLKTTNNIMWYRVSYMEVVEDVAKTNTISMYVFDEGTEKEEAYYGDRKPTQQIIAEVKEV